jgi:hypothetical protein
MLLSEAQIESLATSTALRYARQRAEIREGVTGPQLAWALGSSSTAVKVNFATAVIRSGGPNRATIFSRARVSEILSEANCRPIPYPSKPLLSVEGASAFLTEHGVSLSPNSLRWYRTQRPYLAPRGIRIGTKCVRYSRADLEEFVLARRERGFGQGFRSDLSKEHV